MYNHDGVSHPTSPVAVCPKCRYKLHLRTEIGVAARALPMVQTDMAGRLAPLFVSARQRLVAGLEKLKGSLHVDMVGGFIAKRTVAGCIALHMLLSRHRLSSYTVI